MITFLKQVIYFVVILCNLASFLKWMLLYESIESTNELLMRKKQITSMKAPSDTDKNAKTLSLSLYIYIYIYVEEYIYIYIYIYTWKNTTPHILSFKVF